MRKIFREAAFFKKPSQPYNRKLFILQIFDKKILNITLAELKTTMKNPVIKYTVNNLM